ncbi:FAD-binding protein [Sphingomonas sp. HF-S3]|uniref:FAD-binding protein n=1 Tax=Sphingomonas rustica TaxID=3103142 RepID=A0ABV0B2G2_9SPHN
MPRKPIAPVLDRRHLLGGMAATAALGTGSALAGSARATWVRPGEAGWPAAGEWASLGRAVGDRLAPGGLPEPVAEQLLHNPYYIRDQPGLTQSSGRIDGWRSSPSAYVVRARHAGDVAAAVRFAARHRVRLVVKGGGHSYLGGSTAPDSLLVWTRDMESITLHDALVPIDTGAAPVAAVSVGAGCVWQDVYDAVTTKAGRYVQGGGCATVGVAGLVQGGGFGSLSKGYGLAAASLIEAEIVTADGTVRTVNAARDPDLFWALKGGGGGSWGVVTRLTLRTHRLPDTVGAVRWQVTARSDGAFRALIARFVDLYADTLMNPHWGEQVSARPGNRFEVSMLFQGLDADTARGAWSPLGDWVAARPDDYGIDQPLSIVALPARHLWDGDFLQANAPEAIRWDDRPGIAPRRWWWAGDGAEAGAFWHGYESAWLPASLLASPAGRDRLVDAWVAAGRLWRTSFHFNKGLAGASPDTLAASRATAMNPQVLDAFALAIIAMNGPSAYGSGPPPDAAEARDHLARIRLAMTELRRAAPDAGSYVSECDYALADWQRACWGGHYRRLAAIKARYDPGGLFVVHHGVGSVRDG